MIYLGFVDFIKDKVTNINWGSLIAFLIGIGVGFVIAVLVYLLVVVTSIKNEEKKASKVVLKAEDEKVNAIITNEKNRYKIEGASLSAGGKIKEFGNSCLNMISDISRIYYPESPHPEFELTIDEVIKLDYYIMEKIEKIFSRKLIKRFRNVKIVSVMKIMDDAKKITDNKVVKETTKHASKVWKVLNFINPVYWGKKLITEVSVSKISNKIILTLIDIVGIESSKVYSKSAFNKDDDYLLEELKDMDLSEDEDDA